MLKKIFFTPPFDSSMDIHMASKEYLNFYHKLIARAIPANLSIEETRHSFEHLMDDYPPSPDIRFEPFSIGPLPACWAFAPDCKKHKIVLFFHGGGFNAGSIHSHSDLIGRISQASQCAVLAIGYRLAPEHPYPAALDDAMTAYNWLLHHPFPPSQLALVGISAGGNLLLSLLLRLKLENAHLPAAGVCICPWTDLTVSSPTTKTNEGKDILHKDRLKEGAEMYCDGKNPKDPYISPLYGDLHGLPPLLVQTGTNELLFAEAVALAEKAQKSGVEAALEKWPEMLHAWHLFASKFPEGKLAIKSIGDYLQNKLLISH